MVKLEVLAFEILVFFHSINVTAQYADFKALF